MQFALESGEYKFNPVFNGNRFWKVNVKSNVCIRDISDSYIDNMHNQQKAYIYTEYGILNGKVIISACTEILGKNIGRANQTSNLRQAIQQSESMINKKIQAGYCFASSENNQTQESIYPMALDLYSKYKDKIEYPVYIQPKLDGIRCLVLKEENNGNINSKILSRRLHDIEGFSAVKEECERLFKLSKDIDNFDINFLDGEFYIHGKPLQEISGIVRKQLSEVEVNEDKESLEYHIFDVCLKEDLKFNNRFKLLSSLIKNAGELKKIKLVKCETVTSEQEGDQIFSEYISKGYEGIVYKSNTVYESSTSREKRSKFYLKRKKQMDEEFIIVSFDEGKGKSKGTAVFVLKTPEENEFKCVITGDLEYRKNIYNMCKKDFSKFKGKLAKVKFDDYSKNMTPVRGVIVQLDRDIEFD